MATRRKGSGIMARKLKRTKGGNKVKRRHVKLDTKGLTAFRAAFGKDGIVFKMGLFTKKAATKGAMLEFGFSKGADSDRPYRHQVARPWLSSVLSSNSASQRKILKVVGQFARNALAGRDNKKETSNKLLRILQDHLYQQRFQATKLTDSTIRQKRAKGAKEPHLIGIDSFDLATKLDVRTKGSLNRNIRGK